MVSIRRWSLAAVALTLSLGVHAQGTAPAKSDAKADPKADPKAEEAAAAMERAKRLAAGPMRVILEAGKGRRPAADAAAVDGTSVRAVAVRPPAAQATDAPARPAPPPTLPPAAAAAATEPPAAAPAPSSAPEPTAVSTQVTFSADALPGPRTAAVPGIERTNTAMPAPLPVLPASLAGLTKAGDALVKPRLISGGDLELPQRMLDELGRNAVVAVDVSIRADGSVGGVRLATPVSPRVQRAVASALEQWRFDPLPADRVHRIQLVFNGE